MDVVIVELPAKAKTINKYLGDGYTVLASYGHVRDLPPKDGSVRPDADFAMDWEVDDRAGKHIKAIAEAVRGAERLYLATDPDREGEAISWHVCEVLRQKKALQGVDIKRVVFNEITRGAILDAFARPRDLDGELVEAYLARRALDYLVGFTLSPVLWRKLPGSRSAGRVQSVALRLICERESEIENFRSREYWTVEGVFRKHSGETLTAALTHLDGRKLDKFDLADETAALTAVRAAEARAYAVDSVERKQTRRNPAPPFVTSTLQQEASRKLGFSASHTMRVAQRLYEGVAINGETVGLITYMRTDGVQMSTEAITACRTLIDGEFGHRYLPEKPRFYKTKAKNAQEAHEAIRPTDVHRKPADVGAFLDNDQRRLYSLIWKRTLASQMESAVLDQVAVDIASEDRKVMFRATGSVVAFDGFLRVYREGRDDPETDKPEAPARADEDGERMLPDVQRGEPVDRVSITPEQHFHPTATALYRGEPGQAPGRTRHRPAVHLCHHPLGVAGTQVRASRKPPLPARGQGPAGHGVSRKLLRAVCRLWLHRGDGGAARRRLRRQNRLEGGAARLLAGLFDRRRGYQGAAREGGAGRAGSAAGSALLPR